VSHVAHAGIVSVAPSCARAYGGPAEQTRLLSVIGMRIRWLPDSAATLLTVKM
jgi:hypothetical protein